MINLTLLDWIAFLLILLTSVIYYFVLQWWSKEYPEHFDDNTWLTVVIGCGYVILYLGLTMPFNCWFKLIVGFVISCPPVIYRSLRNNARRRRETADYLENGPTNDQ